jgi:hypothetical protein
MSKLSTVERIAGNILSGVDLLDSPGVLREKAKIAAWLAFEVTDQIQRQHERRMGASDEPVDPPLSRSAVVGAAYRLLEKQR